MKNIKIKIIDEEGGISFKEVSEDELEEVLADFQCEYPFAEITTQKDGITISRQFELWREERGKTAGNAGKNTNSSKSL